MILGIVLDMTSFFYSFLIFSLPCITLIVKSIGLNIYAREIFFWFGIVKNCCLVWTVTKMESKV